MKILVAITGASGSIYGLRLLEELLRGGHQVPLVASQSGLEVCRYETGLELGDAEALKQQWKLPDASLTIRAVTDLWAPEASGSAAPDAMVIAPCSMGTLGRIAHGISANLIERAADVMLKEHRPLLLLPRETPFSTIHLENLLKLSQCGARIIPAMPAFYHRPASVSELVDFVVGKLLDQLGVEHQLFRRWGG
ncbi:UbiX family flavin prenyltransferase [Trichlorobacter lovleyi]|uniref:UbiX family flavin prenyltransferase n=1 Tax=Trichlorobacter lovleyi TaxID=313985 RepID=UPI00223F38F8|nr:flavin prenyltransferase UbiX [Trichlorobacter lovleyi]QOX77629.1 UbiX family flavin prenyltransferase [Trichlorobacter lovleyi]